MSKKVYVVFFIQTDVKYFNILLTQKSSNRATNILKLTNKQCQGLPTGNLKGERHLPLFNKHAEVANCRNRKFTAKSIRNIVMLYRKVQNTVDPAMKIITKLLDERENQWTTNQREACERIKLKLQKDVNLNVMVMQLLIDCKSRGGPVTLAVEII